MRLQKLRNKNHRFGQATDYWYTEIDQDGLDHPLLFCPSEIKSAKRRALRMPKTRPTQWWHRLLGNNDE